MKVLDLGCGDGLTPHKLSFPADWRIVGLDVKYSVISKAHLNYANRLFICGTAEELPFPDSSFDCVVANVALPYMDIARALIETYRVLVPGGTLLASLHSATFELAELRKTLPQLNASVYRVWVLANGIAFHVAGRNFGEAFQTERGMRIALQRANFASVSFRHDSKRWFVEAAKPLKLGGSVIGNRRIDRTHPESRRQSA
jgi:ubiquinone/menaquinone biosynthesis C-methylase UbiE